MVKFCKCGNILLRTFQVTICVASMKMQLGKILPFLVAKKDEIGKDCQEQCEQMATLFFQYLPICNNKMCPIALKKFQIRFNILQNIK